MKKLFTLIVCVLAAGLAYAQPPFPDADAELYLRSGFYLDAKQEKHVYMNDEWKLEKNEETNLYTVQVPLTQYQYDQQDPFTYYYTVVHEGKDTEWDAGPRVQQNSPRFFTLEKDTEVTFYAKLYEEADGRYSTQFCCDAQQFAINFANLYSKSEDGSLSNENVTYTFPRPDIDGKARYIPPFLSSHGKTEFRVFPLTQNNNWATLDIIPGDGKHAIGVADGRWQIVYDYPNFTLNWFKLIDYLRTPVVQAGDQLIDLSLEAPGYDLGEFNNKLMITAGINTYVFPNHRGDIDFEKVSAKLYYTINDLPQSSVELIKEGMQDQDDHWSVTFDLLSEVVLEDGEHTLTFWYETTYSDDTLTDDNNGDYYRVTFTTDTSLRNIGEENNPVFIGVWDEETFRALDLNFSLLTTIDFTAVSSLNQLPLIEGLNPNCLLYISDEVEITNTETNIVVFTEDRGYAATIVITEGQPYNNIRSFEAASITYIRDTGEEEWTTICLPFSPLNIEEYEMKQFTGAGKGLYWEEGDDEEINYVLFNQPDNKIMEPYTAYLIRSNPSGRIELTAENSAVSSTEEDIRSIKTVTHSGYHWVSKADSYWERTDIGAINYYFLQPDGKTFESGENESPYSLFQAYLYSEQMGNGTTDITTLVIKEEHPKDIPPPNNIEESTISDDLSIFYENGKIRIHSSKEQLVEIHSVDGRLLRKEIVIEGENHIEGLPVGAYIIDNQKVVVW